MVAATDIHVQLVKWENRSFQQALMDRLDTYEAALLGLTDAVSRNSERIEVVEQRLEVVNGKLDAIIEHLKVPYNKPPPGFGKTE